MAQNDNAPIVILWHQYGPLSFTNKSTPNFTIMLNFYALHPALYAKFSVNLLAQKLPVESWWNWSLMLLFTSVPLLTPLVFAKSFEVTSSYQLEGFYKWQSYKINFIIRRPNWNSFPVHYSIDITVLVVALGNAPSKNLRLIWSFLTSYFIALARSWVCLKEKFRSEGYWVNFHSRNARESHSEFNQGKYGICDLK